MANEKRFIDLCALGIGKRNPNAFIDPERAYGWNDLLEILETAPAVDAVEVVRCRECKYSALPSSITQKYGVPGTLTCHNRYSPCNNRNVSGEGFCPYGERKDGNGNG